MKKILLIALGLLALFTIWFYWKHPLTAKVRIDGHVIPVELAVTDQEKQLGLGGRKSLAPVSGMLFTYDHPEQYPFWMKGMQFPLDFVWINDKTVVDLTPNVPVITSGPLPLYHPKVAVDKILELNAGEIQKFGIRVGDKVEFLN